MTRNMYFARIYYHDLFYHDIAKYTERLQFTRIVKLFNNIKYVGAGI